MSQEPLLPDAEWQGLGGLRMRPDGLQGAQLPLPEWQGSATPSFPAMTYLDGRIAEPLRGTTFHTGHRLDTTLQGSLRARRAPEQCRVGEEKVTKN